MKQPSRLAFLLAGALAAAPALAGPSLHVCGPNAWATGLTAVGDSQGDPPAFSVAATEDLTLTVKLPRTLPAQPVLVLTVMLPDGFVYQRVEVPLAVDGKRPGRRRLTGYPLAVEERAVTTRGNDRVVDVALPVGGTTITTGSLYGEWRVHASIAGGPACRDAQRFVLAP